MKNKKRIYFILILLVVIDQVIKFITINKNITIIPSVLSIKYVENTGAAFSILNNDFILILFFSMIIMVLLCKFLKDRKEQLDFKQIIPLCIILGGAIGNLIDRIFRGYVIDYIKIDLFYFLTFNIADICIVIGVIWIGFDIVLNDN